MTTKNATTTNTNQARIETLNEHLTMLKSAKSRFAALGKQKDAPDASDKYHNKVKSLDAQIKTTNEQISDLK